MDKSKKTKKRNYFARVFTASFLIVTVLLMVSLADLFSSLIAVGGFTFVSDEVNISKYTLYAICTSSHSSKILADEQASLVMDVGGAGYVWMTDNLFFVVASIYESESDAQKVRDNLIESKPQTTIKEIVCPQIKVSSNLSSQEKETLTNSLSIFKSTYKGLYDISVSLDTGVINEVNARLAINEVSSKINTALNNFNTIFQNTALNLSSTKNALKELGDIVSLLSTYSSGKPYTSKIKNTYSQAIFIYSALASELS